MNTIKRLRLGIFLLCFPGLAFAYVDPGTGAYLLQLIIAVFGAAVFYLTHPAQFIKSLFKRFFKKKD